MAETKPDSLASALAKLQASMPEVRKGETARVKSDKGNYSYTYANLADCSRAILPKLADLGLSFTSKPTVSGAGQFVLAYALRHDSGDSDEGRYPLPDPGRSTPQQVGSAITYARRYALCAITGLAPDDDDDDGKLATDGHLAAERREEQEREAEDRRRAESQQFIAEFMPRIDEAGTTVQIAALEAEAKRKFQGGVISSVEARTLKELIDTRAAEIVAAKSSDEQTEMPV